MKSAPSSLRIVVDTNVFISAIVFGGNPRKVMDLIADDTVLLIVSQEMITEVRRIITDKFSDFLPDLQKVEVLIEADAAFVKLGSISLSVSRDPDDDKFIEAAVLGNCQYIVSGDSDLLDLSSYNGIRILKPTDFLQMLAEKH